MGFRIHNDAVFNIVRAERQLVMPVAQGTTLHSRGSVMYNSQDNSVYVSNGSSLFLLSSLNDATNVGDGVSLFNQKTDDTLEFLTLNAGTNITIQSGSTSVTIDFVHPECEVMNTGATITSTYQTTFIDFKNWAAKVAGTNVDTNPAIATDSGNNVIAAGSYASSLISIFNSDGTTAATLPNNGLYDMFVTKYNNAGIMQWAAQVAGIGYDDSPAVTTDGNNNVFIGGAYTSASLTIYSSNGDVGSTLSNSGNYDTFVAKYNSTGTVQWGTKISSAGGDFFYALTSDTNNNILAGGKFSGLLSIYNSDGNIGATLANTGSGELFIAKYNTSGSLQWATSIGGTGNDDFIKISTDPDDNVIAVGSYASTSLVIYNSDRSTGATLANLGSSDVFVAKYNSDGDAQWVAQIGGTGAESLPTVTSDTSSNVIVCGHSASDPIGIYNFDGTLNATLDNVGSKDVFVAKYNSTGTNQWATRISGTNDEQITSISSDSDDNIIVSGQYDSTAITIYNSDGSVGATLVGDGSDDVFVTKYNSVGNVQWATRIGGGGDEEFPTALADTDDNVIVGGRYKSGPVILYNSDGSTGATLSNVGSSDMFIAKYSPYGSMNTNLYLESPPSSTNCLYKKLINDGDRIVIQSATPINGNSNMSIETGGRATIYHVNNTLMLAQNKNTTLY